MLKKRRAQAGSSLPAVVGPSLQRYHTLFNALAEGVVMLDSAGVVIAANPSAARILGMKPADMTKRLRNDDQWRALREDGTVFPPGEFPIRKTLLNGKAQKNVLINVKVGGRKRRWLSVNTQPVYAPGSRKVRAVVASFEDVTEQRRVAEERSRFAAAVHASADAITSSNAAGRFVTWNAGAEQLFGYTAKEMIGQSVKKIVPPELLTQFEDKFNRVMAGEAISGWASQRIAKDGRRIAIDSSLAPIRDRNNKVIGVVGIGRDVSKIDDMLARLKASEQLFRLALNGTPDMFLIYGHDLRLQFVNEKAIEVIGKPLPEIVGRRDEDILPAEATRVYLPTLMRARDTKSVQTTEGTLIIRGRRYSVSVTFVPMLDDARNITQILGIVNDFTKRRQTEERLAFMAQYDSLTGLPNRYLLLDRLEAAMARAKRNNTLLGVMFLDLDRFKEINDTRGHATGDILLQQVAERLAGVLRASDTISRLGGDEFTVLVENVASIDEITSIADKIKSVFAKPFDTETGEIFTTTSIGITVYPFDDHNRDELLKNADIAMYHAKQERNAWQLYRADMNANSATRMGMEVELRRAIEREEFELHYQPQVQISTGRVVGVEALIRWRNHKLGSISPVDFIPLAEDTGLIVTIGEWVLRAACTQCKAWKQAGLAPLPVAVNISAPQFRRSNLLQIVQLAMRDSNLDAGWIALEITESSIMKHAEQTVKTLLDLRDMGVGLAIDDFGTGYSSLSYLKRLPVNKIKIDQTFVRDIGSDPNDAAIVSAIIAMSKQLDIKSVAEGVETREQLEFLTRLGCDEYQGHLFCRPVPGAQIPDLVRSRCIAA